MGTNWISAGDIHFIKEDVKLEIKMSNPSVFDTGGNWELRIYKDKKLAFQSYEGTTLRPDTVLWSKHIQTIDAIEMTLTRRTRERTGTHKPYQTADRRVVRLSCSLWM